ncbi:phage protein NinX family protein [Comamonas sp. J-3]|uniref:phage protein NinX family protein n=1 Tax=Comamonas trifloxystrobinivorans TaxID=3350256 RepID=UPI00372A91EA
MATVQTSKLNGAALDYAVAVALGYTIAGAADEYGYTRWRTPENCELCYPFEPSSDYATGFGIAVKNRIGISPPTARVHRIGGPNAGWGASGVWTASTWHAGVDGKRNVAWHETEPLVAAMRCYVASKLGSEVDVPDCLIATPKEPA